MSIILSTNDLSKKTHLVLYCLVLAYSQLSLHLKSI